MTNNYFGDLGNLCPAKGAVKKEKRIGRGRGSGHGDRATKGNKGAQSRSGYTYRPGFEGGQMPLQRRVPKRGFNVPNRTEYLEIKLTDLHRIAGTDVNPATVRLAGLAKGKGPIVLLGGISTVENLPAYNVEVHRITKPARAAVEKAGGKVTILTLEPKDRRVKKGPKPKPKTKK
ncbi:MAG: 50S ribosomal protein L15 [Calditrichaeota bacterium]|nr:50S ribosomal protein L15 [Calditrichota bacterium]